MNKYIAQTITKIIPTLNKLQNKKGDHGRIAVIGGSFEFTGAPFYSALSALKTGSDMAHIFCSKSAAIPIKAYSPEIIVHPVFSLSDEFNYQVQKQQMTNMHELWMHKILDWQKAITGWIVGPGLGRDRHMEQFFPLLLSGFPKNSLLVLDADAIYYLCKNPDLFNLLKDYRSILTPNHTQLGYLKKHLKIQINDQNNKQQTDEYIKNIQTKYDYPFNILVKGNIDYYLTKDISFKIKANGGKKRCGGIGDILSGSVITCARWDLQYGPALAAMIIKKATQNAFNKQGRGLTAPNIISEISKSFKQIEDTLLKSV